MYDVKRTLLLSVLLVSCAHYSAHDPNGYCQERHLEPRLRPVTDCHNKRDDPGLNCVVGATFDLHWKCDRWSSW